MQIDEVKIVVWLWGGMVALFGIVGVLLLFIWRGDRTRLKTVEEGLPHDAKARLANLEEKMTHAVTMPQVEHLASELKKEFKDDHASILHGQNSIMIVIDNRQDELKDYIRDMFNAREVRWNGRDRRMK